MWGLMNWAPAPGIGPDIVPGMGPDIVPGMAPDIATGVAPDISPMVPAVGPGMDPEKAFVTTNNKKWNL